MIKNIKKDDYSVHNKDQSTTDVDLIQLQLQFYDQLKSKGRSHNTLKNYKTDLDCFNQYLQSTQKSLDISQISIPEIQQYGQYLENRYKSDNSRRRRVQALRSFFDFLVETQIFSSNPVKKIPTSPKFLDIPRPTSLSDIRTLWEYLLKEGLNKNPMHALLAKRNQVILVLIYGGGLKISDLVGLKENHLSLKTNSPRVLIQHPKRDPYTVPLPEVFLSVYQDYKELLDQIKKRDEINFDEVLFNANPYKILNGGISARGLEVVFKDFSKILMIDSTPKSLRQSCIFKWLKQKHQDTLIKEWMGVAPSYSLKLYREHLPNNVYDDHFLAEIYASVKKREF